MQKNVCAICLQPVNLDIDILQQSDDIKCVHYSCLNQSQVGQRILAQASYEEDQSDEHETIYKTSFLGLSKRPAFCKLSPFNQSLTLGNTPNRRKKPLYPVQEYYVDHEVHRKTSKSISKNSSSSGSTKLLSSMRKRSYKIMPLFVRKSFLRKGQQNKLPQNRQGDEATVFPFLINASDIYSSEILDWLATQDVLPSSLQEKPMPATSKQNKKKVTIQEKVDPYLTEHRNRDYRKPLPRRASRRRREIPAISIGSQYSNHNSKLSAADFMEWVTSAPKIPNGNMLILLDCRNKKDTKNIGVQPSFNEKSTDRKTAESLILDLLDGRKRNDLYEYYPKCQSQRSSLVKTCTTVSQISTLQQEKDSFHEVTVMEEPRYIYPETVEERMHHVVSIIFSTISHISGFFCRFAKVIKDELTSCDKHESLDSKSQVI